MSNFNVGDTGKSVTFRVFDGSGVAVSALVAATLPDIYWAPSGGDGTKITLSDLASIGAAWSSGGVHEKAGSAGAYRLCLPNAALASADEITIYGEATGKSVVCEPITVGLKVDLVDAPNAAALTAAANALLELANGVETGMTPQQALRGIAAALFGKLTTAGQNPEVYQNPAGTTNRLSVTNDASGNRTTVTTTL